ncbi:ribosome recycling factor [Candidatus Dependentiae bacterium]|nr:MAG: ribosome recycling factor [Candidatus Dependentiae bacterium]
MALDIQLAENDIKSFQTPMEAEMDKSIKHFEGELIKIRTGRAHTSLVENIEVAAYGAAPMALKGLSVLAAPDARLITIQPWDVSIIPDIERAIGNAGIGITPRNDGRIIRLQLPEISTDRREELVKVLGKKLEECKVSLRNTRKDFNNLIRDAKKDKTISENFHNRLEDVLQKITDKFVYKADELDQKKKKELTTI